LATARIVSEKGGQDLFWQGDSTEHFEKAA
jgi:hypothetical protein